MFGTLAHAIILTSMVGVSAPQWETDYGQALARTKADNRPLLIVLEDPSKSAKTSQIKLASANKEALKNYELCRVDVTTSYGKKVAKAFKATTFPYTAIIERTGKRVVYRRSGKISESEWKTVLGKHRYASAPVRVQAFKPITSPAFQGYNSPGYCPSCQKNNW